MMVGAFETNKKWNDPCHHGVKFEVDCRGEANDPIKVVETAPPIIEDPSYPLGSIYSVGIDFLIHLKFTVVYNKKM